MYTSEGATSLNAPKVRTSAPSVYDLTRSERLASVTNSALAYLSFAAFLVVPFFVFRYLAGFSETQASTLTLFGWFLGVLMYGLLSSSPREHPENFVPFRIRIRPRWERLLRDYCLLTTNEDWDCLREQTAKWGDSEYHLLRDGLTFITVNPHLIFWDERKTFRSKVDFTATISEITVPLSRGYFSPSFYVQENRWGYEFGVVTPKSYSSGNPEDEASIRVSVATLPYEALDHLWKRTTPWLRRLAKVPNSRDLGWNWNDTLEMCEHEYIEVDWNRI